jgi:MFS family permease
MQAYFSGVWGLSSVLGPVVGGFITDQFSWHWVFFINLPVGLAAALIMGAALKEPKYTVRPAVDYAGAGLLMASITLLMLALVEGGTTFTTFFAAHNLIFIVSAIVLLALFAFAERRAADPIIPFHLFKNRTVSVSVGAGFLAGVSMFGAISFVPLFAQGALGSTATEAGSLLTPLMVSWVIMSVVGGRLMLKLSYRSISLVGFVLLTVGFVFLAMFEREMWRGWLYADLILIGSGLGLTMLTLLIAVQQAVDKAELGVATSLNQFARSIGGAFGVAVMGAVLSAGLAANLNKAAAGNVISQPQAEAFAANPNALIDPQAQAGLPAGALDVLRDAMANSIHKVFWVGALLAALSLLVALLLPRANEQNTNSETTEKDLPDAESGERLIMAELTRLESKNEPAATTGS